MRFASTASRLAGRRLHHPRYPHRRHQLPAGRSCTAGGLVLTAIEGRFAGFGLLASSSSTALRTATKAASGSIQLLSFDDQAVQAGFVRVTGCLDAIHPGIHNGASCVAGDFRRPQRHVAMPTPSLSPTWALYRGWSSSADATSVTNPQWPGSWGALCALAPAPTRSLRETAGGYGGPYSVQVG
jgi:hypothetical protein